MLFSLDHELFENSLNFVPEVSASCCSQPRWGYGSEPASHLSVVLLTVFLPALRYCWIFMSVSSLAPLFLIKPQMPWGQTPFITGPS